MTNQIFRRNKK